MSVWLFCSVTPLHQILLQLTGMRNDEYLKAHKVTDAELTAIWKDVPKPTKDVRSRNNLLSGYPLLIFMQKFETQARKLKKVCKVISSKSLSY